MKKTYLFFIIFHLSVSLYSQEIESLIEDTKNIFTHGLRPISQGKDYYIHAQGSLRFTRVNTDFAISRNGFFVLLDMDNNKIFLTRNGQFSFNKNGYLVNHDNMYVLNGKSDIQNGNYIFITQTDLDQKFTHYSDQKSGLLSAKKQLQSQQEKQYPFLLFEPSTLECSEIVSTEYLICSDYILCDGSVIPYSLENMPISLDFLMISAITYLSNSVKPISINRKIEMYSQFEKQYKYFCLFEHIDTNYLDKLNSLLLELNEYLY
jgi:flagellar hook protein FlgE